MSARRLKLSDTQQYVLQIIMNRGVLDHSDFKSIYSATLKKFNIADTDQELSQSKVYSQFIREINEAIRFFNVEIQKGSCELTGMSFYCFTRQFDTCSIGKLSSLYQPHELKLFQICLNLIMESEDGLVTYDDIVFQVNEEYDGISTEAQTQSKSVTKIPTNREIRAMIDMFISHYWLTDLDPSQQLITLHGRALIELHNYLKETFDNEILKTCYRCKKICVVSIKCAECGSRYHRGCGKEIFSNGHRSCINCKANFSAEEVMKLKESISEARNSYAKKTNRLTESLMFTQK